MQISKQAQTLNRRPLSAFKTIFALLPPPDLGSLKGIYQAEFTGPGWLRRVAPPE